MKERLHFWHADSIPIHWELILLLNLCTKSSFNIPIPYQTLGTPQSNTEWCTGGLNSKAAMDIREDKLATAEDTFNVDACSYRQSFQYLRQMQEDELLTRNRKIIPSHAWQVQKHHTSVMPPHEAIHHILSVHCEITLEFIRWCVWGWRWDIKDMVEHV